MFFSWIRCGKHQKTSSQLDLWPIALSIQLFVRHTFREKYFFWLFLAQLWSFKRWYWLLRGNAYCFVVTQTAYGWRQLIKGDPDCLWVTLTSAAKNFACCAKNFACCAKNFAYRAKMFFSWIRWGKHQKTSSRSVLWSIALSVHLFVHYIFMEKAWKLPPATTT